MRGIFFLLFIFSVLMVQSQQVDVLWRGSINLSKQKPGSTFYYLEPKIDSSQLIHIAKIRAEGSRSINVLYNSILQEAQKSGANSFRFSNYNSSDESLVLDVYYSGDSMLLVNKLYKEKNYLYIFPGIDNADESHKFKINGERKNLRPDQYFKCKINPGKEIILNKGGVLGTTIVIREKGNKSNIYYSLSGLGLGSSMPYDGMGIAITTGKIFPVDENMAELLTHILNPSE